MVMVRCESGVVTVGIVTVGVVTLVRARTPGSSLAVCRVLF